MQPAHGHSRRSCGAEYVVSVSSDHLIDISLADSSMIWVGSIILLIAKEFRDLFWFDAVVGCVIDRFTVLDHKRLGRLMTVG